MQSVTAPESIFISQEATDNPVSIRSVILTVLAGGVAPALLAYLFATTHEVLVFAIVLGVIALVLTLAEPVSWPDYFRRAAVHAPGRDSGTA